MKVFENVAALKLANLQAGQIVLVKGLNTLGDGGDAAYIIAEGASPEPITNPPIANSNYAFRLQTTASTVARGLNVPNDQVIYSLDTETDISTAGFIYDTVTQLAYQVPDGVIAGETIVSLIDGELITSEGTYELEPPSNADDVQYAIDLAENSSTQSGVRVSRDKIGILGNGSYSWWCEPNVWQLGHACQRATVGHVGITGYQKIDSIDASSSVTETKHAVLNIVRDADEHNVPSMVVVEDDKLFAFHCYHNHDGVIRMRRSNTLHVDDFGPEEIAYTDARGTCSYTQPLYSEEAGGRILVFYRYESTGWAVIWSDDLGDTWTQRDLFTFPSQQCYMLATGSYSTVSPITIICAIHPTFTGLTGLWEMTLDVATMAITTGSSTFPNTLDSALWTEIDASTELNKFFTPSTDRMRLLHTCHRADQYQGILVCEWDLGATAECKYRYVRVDMSDTSIVTNAEICTAGLTIDGSSYFGGAYFTTVDRGGIYPDSPVTLAREENGEWFVEFWDSDDEGETWALSDTVRHTTDGTKLWRPKAPLNTRNNVTAYQIDVVWCEGSFTSYSNYNSHVMYRKRNVNPFPDVEQ